MNTTRTDEHGNEFAPSHVWEAIADEITPAEIGGPDSERSRVVHKAVRVAVDAMTATADAETDRWRRQAEHLASELARCQTDYAEREHQLTREARHLEWRCRSLASRLDDAETHAATAERNRDEALDDGRYWQREHTRADQRVEDADAEARRLAEKCDELTGKLAIAEQDRDAAEQYREADLAHIRRAMGVPAGNAADLAHRLRRWTDAHNAAEREAADAGRLVEIVRAANRRLVDEAADARQRLATWHADEHTAQRRCDELIAENRDLRREVEQARAYARETPRGLHTEATTL